MKVLIIINYYAPYISGLTETARVLAESLAKEKNNKVTVLCSNHEKLPENEVINGVNVVRAPIMFKISKGTVSPAFIRMAKKMSKDYDVVNIIAPMLESGLLLKKLDKKKTVVSYHCDVNLPSSLLNNFIVRTMDFSHRVAMKNCRSITVTTKDYAKSSRVAKDFLDKCVEIAPNFKEKDYVEVEQIKNSIGFCGRIVEEKGIDVLLKAYKIVKQQIPDASLRIAGNYKSVAGGSVYPQLVDYIEKEKIDGVTFLGKVPEEDLAKFYSELGVFVLPSVNSLEAFGMVQLEAMFCGVPVVASDLPGVRTIVQNTKMGLISKISDEKDLAKKIIQVLKNRNKYVVKRDKLLKIYSNDVLVKKYKKLYEEICNEKNI
ncbi:MAG: glycosyltransferase family 4 protein [Bacilli bacterium]